MSPGGVKSTAGSNMGQRGVAASGYLILLVLLAVAAVFGYRYLSAPQDEELVTEGIEATRQDGELAQDGAIARAAPAIADVSDEKKPSKEPSNVGKVTVADSHSAPGLIAPTAPAQSDAPRLRHPALAPDYDFALARELVGGLAQFAPGDGKLLPSDIEAMNQTLEELKRQGPAAVVAIEEYLAAGEDLDFSQWADVKDLPNSTLRLALLDTLGRIDGPEALDAMVGNLATAIDPREIRSLAEGLEANAPERYRTEIVAATRETLALALESDPKEFQDLSHLFGVIQGYGDETMAADLENVYRTAQSGWADYALMALSRLPEGQGVPYLREIVSDLSADPNRSATRYKTALQMLAQASREDPQAEVALMEMAGKGQLSTSDLKSVAATLGGREYQLITAGSEIAKKSKSATFLNGRAAETWTDAEIEQRSAMIEQLLSTEVEPEAEQVLLKASERLAVWKGRPMVNGRRVTR